MRVAGARDVLGGRAVLHGQHALGDHLAGVAADDVHAQDLVRHLVRQDLHHALRVTRRPTATLSLRPKREWTTG